MDDLDRMGCIGQDLHIATVDMEDETCLFRPLMVFCHIVIFSVRLSLFVSLGKRGIYELPYEVYINCLTQYISSGICSISSQKRPVERLTMPKFTSQILLLFSKVLHILEKLLLKNFTGLKVVS